MKNDYQLPKRMPNILNRIVSEYEGGKYAHVGTVIAGSQFFIEEGTVTDNWDGELGHDLIFLAPARLMASIPVNTQNDIETMLANDLNRASSYIAVEYIANVRFDYLDEDEYISEESPDNNNTQSESGRLWRQATIRLFISHLATVKRNVHRLSTKLDWYGISSFVAHDKIEPDEDWQEEIKLALQSMDAMLVYITDDFFDSVWTNQEIGYALARGVPIVSIKMGTQDPIGFISKRQAINGMGKDLSVNALQIKSTLRKKLRNSPRYRKYALSRFNNAGSFDEAGEAFEDIKPLPTITSQTIESLIKSFNSNSQLNECFKLTDNHKFLNWLNEISSAEYVINRRKIVEKPKS